MWVKELILTIMLVSPCASTGTGLEYLTSSGPDTYLMSKSEWVKDNKTQSCHNGPYKEAILRPGCKPRFIKNRFCYGQCNSYYVPQIISNFRICNACVPVQWHFKEIRLKCLINNEWLHQRHNITIVKKCKCQEVSCDKKKKKRKRK